jgi:hypothetical protein
VPLKHPEAGADADASASAATVAIAAVGALAHTLVSECGLRGRFGNKDGFVATDVEDLVGGAGSAGFGRGGESSGTSGQWHR